MPHRPTPEGSSRPAGRITRSFVTDDAGHLRCCPACDCPALYARTRGIEVVAAVATGAAVLAAAAGGLLTPAPAAGVLCLVAGAGLAAHRLRGPFPAGAGPVLCCYRCDARFGGLAPSRAQRRWSARAAATHGDPEAVASPQPAAFEVVIAEDLVPPAPRRRPHATPAGPRAGAARRAPACGSAATRKAA